MDANLIKEKYTSIGFFIEGKNWEIIRNKETNLLYLQKKLQQYNLSLYECLKECPHPNIARIEAFYETEDGLCVIEEYIQGKTLEQLLLEQSVLQEEDVIQITISLCKALEHLHNLPNPIIHRDIKLANIMVDSFSHVLLVDFNVSRFYNQQMNMDTTILGTEGYAAPEQFGFTQTDARSDIYSLGIVMNYLLTGLHPKEFLYEGKLRHIIQKCIHFDPDNRYCNAILINQDLCSIHKDLEESINNPIWVLPGFRTRKVWKKGLAIFGYLSTIGLIMSHSSKYTNKVMMTLDTILFGILICSVLILYTNYLNIHSYLEFFNSPKKFIRISGYFTYSFILVLIYACSVVVFATIFK